MSAFNVSRENEMINISIPASINSVYLEQLLDYLKVKSIASESQATDEEVVELASEINKSWWQANRQHFIK